MSEMAFNLPKGMSGEDVAKTLVVYLLGLGAYEGAREEGLPHPDNSITGEMRWQLDDANNHWLHVKPDGSARVVSRHNSRTPILLVNLFLDRYESVAA